MPRVNRDLQRRMAARRERERRRPSERRYRFASPEAVDAPGADAELFDGAPEMLQERDATGSVPPRARAAAARQTPARFTPKPFSAYREEYSYVGSDLRRIVAVVGSILVVLVILHFVLLR